MLSGKVVGRKNIFINFMLTAKRIELSKLVRQAKKDNQIQKYSIDQNGKIFVIKTGENDYKEVTCVDDINSWAYIPSDVETDIVDIPLVHILNLKKGAKNKGVKEL